MLKTWRLETLAGPPPKKLVQSRDNLLTHRQYDDPDTFITTKRSRWTYFILKDLKSDYFPSLPIHFRQMRGYSRSAIDISECLCRKFIIDKEDYAMCILIGNANINNRVCIVHTGSMSMIHIF